MRKAFNAGLVVLILVACGAAVWMLSSYFQDREPVDYEVIVDTPQAGDMVTPPLTIVGKAHANWYSEGMFPVEVRNSNGDVIGQGMAERQDGRSDDKGYLTFKAVVSFKANPGENGFLVFKRSNPDGQHEYDLRTEVPVTF